MAKEEVDFPRGGKKQKENIGDEQNKKEGPGDKLRPEKAKEKQQSRKRQNADESPFEQPAKKFKKNVHVEAPLQNDALCVNMVVLACVKNVHPHSISVSLPGNQSATVSVTNLSEAYSMLLQQLSMEEEDELDQTDVIVAATEFLKPGFFIPVAIKSISDSQGNKHKSMTGSFRPSDIAVGVLRSDVQDGMLLSGNVSSVEDHGYRIDTGIKGLQVFLNDADAQTYIDKFCAGKQLCVGQPLWCIVQIKDKKNVDKSENRVVNVRIDPDLIEKTKLPQKTKMNMLLPGMKVSAHVKSVGDQGLVVTFGTFEAMLHGSHLPAGLSSYSVNQAIDAAILYVHPESKTIHLTALDVIVKQNGTAIDMFSHLEIGDTLQASVLRLVKKKGIYFKLPHNKKGFAALSQLSDDTDAPDINKYKSGQTVQCRVMGFNHMEGLALVTLKKSILEQKFITVSSLKPGDIAEATIINVLPKGVSVMLSKKIYSFIPRVHMANVPIAQLSKKFESGMQLKCRVMEVDVAKSKVSLTHKPALLKTKAQIPTDYTQLSRGDKVTGVITVLKESYVLVRFFNNVQGIVMLSEMCLEQGQSPLELFYLGQVVRCRVVTVNTDQEKLKLSFNLGDQKRREKEPEEEGEETLEPVDLTPGLVSKAKITGVEKDFYKLILMPGKHQATLPFDHLSDYLDIQDLRKMTFNKDHILSKVSFFKTKRKSVVTMKESFIKAAEDKLYVTTIDDLEVGMLLPAVIKNHQDYGFFVELAGGLTGLCPARTLATTEPSELKNMYPEGRSVLIRVVRIDKEKGRFLGGVAKQDCVRYGEDDPVRFLQDYLESREKALGELTCSNDKLKPYGNVKVGSVIEVTVSSVYKKGVLCELPSGLKAIATHHHLGGVEPEPGKQYLAVVLDLDVTSPCLEVTLDSKFCKAVTTRTENPSSQVKAGQTLKAELLLIKEGFLLMKLKGHGAGKLVYVPVKQHFNDVYVPPNHKIGMYSDVVIKGNVGGSFIGVLKTRERKSSKTETDTDGKENVDVKNLPLHDIQVGNVVEAKVKSVHPFQMNLVSDRIQGRVHITEVTDDIGKRNPLVKYKKGDDLKVKVIGLRNMKMQSYMPITKPKVSRTLLECSLKESKMDVMEPKELMNEELSTFIGAEMTVYVIKVDQNKLWVQASLIHQGSISLFHASNNMEVLNKAASHFKVGQPLRATVIGKTDNDKINFSLIGPEVGHEIGSEVTALITGAKGSKYFTAKLYKGSPGIIDSLYPEASMSIGQYVRCKVMAMSSVGIYQLSPAGNRKRKVPGSDQETEKTVQKELTEDSGREEGNEEDGQAVKKKAKKVSTEEDGEGVSVEEESNPSHTVTKKDTKAAKDALRERTKEMKAAKKNSQEVGANPKMPTKTSMKKGESSVSSKNRLTVAGFAWGQDLNVKSMTSLELSDDDDDDDDDVGITKADNKSRRKRNREQEKIIEEYEKQQVEGKSGPQSVNDFERLVLQSPNSSMVWLGFMAYHLELGEVAKAKAVAEKALNTIVFREEQEKKNVWLAYLNLETMYGDSEDLKKLLQRAVTYNDPLEINLKMCDIYVGANKIEDAEQQYNLLIKKFKKEKVVWKSYAQFLYKQDRYESARNILKRCLTALDKRDHVEVISRFANLEFSHGNPERGRTMFENLIASYPGRTDIWSVYVDMVVKSGDIVGARQLLERAVKQKLNTKKLSFLIQKFIKFEETHGTDDQVQKVKDLAVSLFDS